MAARDVTDGVSHRQHGQPEREGDTQKADPQVWKARSQYRGATAAQHQPQRSEELSGNPPRHVDFHESPPSLANNTLSVRIEVLNNLSCGVATVEPIRCRQRTHLSAAQWPQYSRCAGAAWARIWQRVSTSSYAEWTVV